jgi:hypothetical protein
MSAGFLPRLITAAALIVAATFPVSAASLDTVTDRGVLRFAVYRDFPPFSHRAGGTLEGADVDLAKAIGAKLGLGVEFMELTADENMDDDLRNAVWKGPILAACRTGAFSQALRSTVTGLAEPADWHFPGDGGPCPVRLMRWHPLAHASGCGRGQNAVIPASFS